MKRYFPFISGKGERSDKIDKKREGRSPPRVKGVRIDPMAIVSCSQAAFDPLRNNHLDLKTIAISPLSSQTQAARAFNTRYTPLNDRRRLFNRRHCTEKSIQSALRRFQYGYLLACVFEIAKLNFLIR